ncbi:MAG TPA: hypothetical protein VD862_00185 [Candidatus Paceibacterota bacterium]|nr:hypothetical protein [Candidatus Paceibacterota bacterium]
MRTGIAFIAGALAIAVLPACAPTYRGEFEKLADQENWTKEQKRAAREYSYRYFGQEQEDGTYTVRYSRLSLELVVSQVDSFLTELDAMLSYKNEYDNKYLKAFNQRAHFEHQEDIFKGIRARIRLAELHDVFERMLGKRSSYSSTRDEYGYDHAQGYDPSILALDPDELVGKYPFKNEVIDEAKAAGQLQEVQRYSVSQNKELAVREPDPDFPDDPNKFVWKKKQYALELVVFKILIDGDTPRDNYGNYAEVYRTVAGVRESKPAVRAFMDGRGGSVIAVIDTHREAEHAGYGLPDYVDRVSEGSLASVEMIERIFPEDAKAGRVEPRAPEVRVEIVPIGTEIDVWERCENGCKVPFPYQNEGGDNYTVDIRFKRKPPTDSRDRTRTVEYIEKRWTPSKPGAGEVVEYFKPRSPFDKPALGIRVVRQYDSLPSKLEYVFPDGTEETVIVTPGKNKAIHDEPTAVGYNWAGKRYLIMDEDGDGRYEKRREVADLTSGSYYGRIDDFGTEGGGYHEEPIAPEEPEGKEPGGN